MNPKVKVKPFTLDMYSGRAIPPGIYTLVQLYENYAIIQQNKNSTYKVASNRIFKI